MSLMLIFSLVASYLLGSIPNGLWLGKALWQTDLRKYGSHNIGATNAWRTLGKGPGFLIFFLDMLKGLVSVWLGSVLVGTPVAMILCGIFAIIGHSRQGKAALWAGALDKRFQVVWPDKGEFELGGTETFDCRDGEVMIFSRWFEDPDYREDTVLRKYPGGEIIETLDGPLMVMKDGKKWLLER